MLTITIKPFAQLTAPELYEVLRLRSEVFVVEQACIYQDIDGKDSLALHIMGIKNNQLVAYTRIFGPGEFAPTAIIGRVAVKANERKHGYGREIMRASIEAIAAYFNETKITLSAQTYLINFYNSLGFHEVGERYLEDGIPHIKMIKN